MSRTRIVYDQVCKKNIVIKNLIEEPPMEWTPRRIANYIKSYLIPRKDIVNLRCNNPDVMALL